MSIILSKRGQSAQKLEKSEFEREDYLQNYIHENPEAIPVYEITEDKRLLVISREFPTESGPIDAVAIDKDGDLYIVETKLFKNPDKRTVVAQALDYGASLWKHTNNFAEFIRKIDSDVQSKFHVTLEEKIKDFFKIEQDGVQSIFDNINNNLKDGNIKFVILMDSMSERLKDLIIYVNQNSQFDIYAVQLEYYRFQEYEIVIPKIFGVEVKKNIIGPNSSKQRRKWNEADFIAQSRDRLADDSQKVVELYNFLKRKSDKVNWGTGSINGSFSPVFFRIHKNISIFSVYSDGSIVVKFPWLKGSLGDIELEKMTCLFESEIKKNTSIEISKSDLLEKEIRISSEDFVRNYLGLRTVITKMVE